MKKSHLNHQTRESFTSVWTPLTVGAAIGAGSATAGVVGSLALSSYFARQVVVPPRQKAESLKIISVGYASTQLDQNSAPASVRLPATTETLAPGQYGLYFNAGQSFAVLGDILSYMPSEQSVVRQVIEVRRGDLAAATKGRMSGVVARTPEEAGYAAQEIALDLSLGPAPAWLIHPKAALPAQSAGEGSAQNSHEVAPPPATDAKPSDAKPSDTWAIMVHGMGATRAETLRALETTQHLGLTSLHMAYRNDREAPPSGDGRYGLGFTEWQDVDVAIEYALAHGAKDVVLFGWSMGGAICLQTMKRAYNRQKIRAMVLDGPAVDWLELIQYHSQMHKIPLRLGELGMQMISKPALNIFTGLKQPIELESLSWTRHARSVTVPTLIMHSLDDTFVPAVSSQKLAEKSPLVDFLPFFGATHTREWNVDPERWFEGVNNWLAPRLAN